MGSNTKRNLGIFSVVIVGIALGAVFLIPPEQVLPTFAEYVNYDDEVFNLRFDPLAVSGAQSFLIKCDIRNTIQVFDSSGTIRLFLFADSPTFSPFRQLDFLIGTSGTPLFGTATITTLLSCEDSPLSGSGFKPFLTGGSVQTLIKGYNFDKDLLDIKSSNRAISGTVDMNNRQFHQLNQVTISLADLERVLKDEFSYTSTVTATNTGTLLFRQCLTSNPSCTGADATAIWEHTIKPNDAFSAFGLIVEGSGFAPLSSQQEVIILNTLEEGGKLNLAEDARMNFKIRLKNYSPQETIPSVKIFWQGNPDPFDRMVPEQIRTFGILTQTEDGGTFHIGTGSFTISNQKLGQWCVELQPDETGIRTASKKCLIAYNEVVDPDPVIDPMDGNGDTGTISNGELRIGYEIQTKDKVFKNDITSAGGVPIAFDPLGLVGAGTKTNVIFDIFISPQLFFNTEILKNLNVIQTGSDVEYTGTITTSDQVITIPDIDLRPDNNQVFTKNQASIVLPATKISGTELEEILLRNGVSSTSTTQATLSIDIGGTVLLEETGNQAQWRGVLKGATFDWNFDYVPAGTDDIINDEPVNDCQARGGTMVNQICVIPEDVSKCFDGTGTQIECDPNNPKVTEDPNVENPNTAQCFGSDGNEIVCGEDVPTTCDVNTDPDRCGGGQIQGDEEEVTGETPKPTICLGFPFDDCAEAGGQLQEPIPIPTLVAITGDPATDLGILIAMGVAIILFIGIGIRLARR
jgi:hypothetical protein